MTAYEQFAGFYDEVMDDPGPRAERVVGWIERFHPTATSLLELGCGTGSLLARLPGVASLTGLDRSPGMLSVAASKVPGARLVEGDMRDFDLGRRFDVVCCVFDSLNHLLEFEEWVTMFGAVHAHLADDGLFLFDVNTTGELHRLGDEPPWVYDFDGGTAIIDVSCADEAAGAAQGVASVWDIRIFERVSASRFFLHHERIGELAVPLDRVRQALAPGFILLEEVGDDDLLPTDDSIKGHFAYRRRPL